MNPPILISEVEVVPVKPRSGLIGFASCIVNDQLYVGDIGIHVRPDGNGYRLVFPLKVLPTGKEIHCVHPITHEAGDAFHQAIVGKLEIVMANARQGIRR